MPPVAGSALIFAEEFEAPHVVNGRSYAFNPWDAQLAPNGMWRTDFGYGGMGDYKFNDEMQIYSGPFFENRPGDFDDGNYVLSDGALALIAKQTAAPLVLAWNQGGYSSAMITTRGLEPWLGGPSNQFSFQYGYVEARIDPSEEPGAWNAFWLLPAGGDQNGWHYAEVDIMEKVGQEAHVWHAVHGAVEHGQYALSAPNTPGYHTYGLDWNAQTMTWYVDGVQTMQIATPSDMHQPMVLIANLAVGGSWAKAPDFGADGQAQMLIDYIRVYEHPGETTFSFGAGGPPTPPQQQVVGAPLDDDDGFEVVYPVVDGYPEVPAFNVSSFDFSWLNNSGGWFSIL